MCVRMSSFIPGDGGTQGGRLVVWDCVFEGTMLSPLSRLTAGEDICIQGPLT